MELWPSAPESYCGNASPWTRTSASAWLWPAASPQIISTNNNNSTSGSSHI